MTDTNDTTSIDPETLMIMSAAIAAYLGKNVRIRKARFIRDQGPSAWSIQGRVSIQAGRHTQGMIS